MVCGRPLRAGGVEAVIGQGTGGDRGSWGSGGAPRRLGTGPQGLGRGFSDFGFCSQFSEKPRREFGCEIYFGARSPGCWVESGLRGASVGSEGPAGGWAVSR